MRLSRALTFLLLFGAVLPPPRVANYLIAEVPRTESAESRKTQQARGRNRIGSPVRTAPCGILARIAGGDARPPRSSRFLARRDVPATFSTLHPSASSPVHPADLHLRC